MKNQLESVMTDVISRCVALFFDHFVRREQQRRRFPYIKVLISGVMGNLLVCWIKQKEPISMEELTAIIMSF